MALRLIKTWLRRTAGTNNAQHMTVPASDSQPASHAPAAPLPKDTTTDHGVPVAADGSNPYSRRERFILTELVYSLLLPDDSFTILDGGARGGPSDPRWSSIGDKQLVIHGFEVDATECQRLNCDASERGLPHHYYPIALWSSEGPLTIYENKASGGASAYRQNLDLTNRWKFQNSTEKFYARDIFFPTGETTIAATTVDQWASNNGITEIDFVKLNVQGAELEILKSAGETLPSILGIELEVSFVKFFSWSPVLFRP